MKMKKFIGSTTGKITIGALTAAIIAAGAAALILLNNTGYRSIRVDELSGTTVVSSGAEEREAFEGQNLKSGDSVNVKKNSDLTLELDSDKHVYAAELTRFSLEATGTSGKDSRTLIKLEKGCVLSSIDSKLGSEESYVVKTPNASMSVRGTVFTVTYYEDTHTTVVEVKEGEVLIESANGIETAGAGETRTIRDSREEAAGTTAPEETTAPPETTVTSATTTTEAVTEAETTTAYEETTSEETTAPEEITSTIAAAPETASETTSTAATATTTTANTTTATTAAITTTTAATNSAITASKAETTAGETSGTAPEEAGAEEAEQFIPHGYAYTGGAEQATEMLKNYLSGNGPLDAELLRPIYGLTLCSSGEIYMTAKTGDGGTPNKALDDDKNVNWFIDPRKEVSYRQRDPADIKKFEKIRDFSFLREMPELIALDICSTDFSDLSALKELNNLMSLAVYGGSDGKIDYASLKELKSLKTLAVSGRNVTQADIDALQAALPDCYVAQ